MTIRPTEDGSVLRALKTEEEKIMLMNLLAGGCFVLIALVMGGMYLYTKHGENDSEKHAAGGNKR